MKKHSFIRRTIAATLALAGMFMARNALAATPVAVWDGDFSSTTSGTGTLSLNGNSQSDGVITIDQSVGVLVNFSSSLSAMTVLVKYSDLSLTAQGTMATSYASSVNNRTGIYLTSAGATYGIWGNSSWSTGGTGSTVTATEGTYAFVYSATDGTSFYQITDSTATALYSKSGLKSGNDASNIAGCAIGGERGSSSLGAATGMKITGIAVFGSVLTTDEMTGYTWPSEIEAVTATLSDTTATWSDKSGMTLDNTWTDSSSTALKVVNNLTSDATFTFDSDITASQLILSGSGNTTIEKGSSATVTIPDYDLSGATGTTTLNYSWGDSTVEAGSDLVVDTANLGSGTVTVGAGHKITYSGTTALTSFPFMSAAEEGTVVVNCPVELDSSNTEGFNPAGGTHGGYRFGSNASFTACKMTLGNGSSGTQKIYQDGGTITLTSSTENATSSPLVVGHWPITAYFYSYGGTLTAANAPSILGWNGYSYWYIGDGSSDNSTAQVNLKGLVIGRPDASANGRAKQLHLQTGGTLTVGSSGITVPYDHSNTVVTMAGGTLACSADASITLGSSNTSTASTTTHLAPASGYTMTIASALNGSGNFSIDGPGTVALSTMPTTTGSLVIGDSGTLSLAPSSDATMSTAISGTGDLVIDAGDYTLTDTNKNITATGSLTVNSGTFNTSTGENGSKGLATVSSTIVNSGATLVIGQNAWEGNLSSTLVVSNATLEIQRYNKFPENTTLDTATVKVTEGNSNDYWKGLNIHDTVTVNGGETIVTQTVSAVAAQTQVGASAILNVTSGATLTFNTIVANYQGGTGTLTKNGDGTVNINHASTYTGATTVNAGTLGGTGSLTASAVTVKSGATLSGTLAVAGSVTLEDGAVLDLSSNTDAASYGTFTQSGALTISFGDRTITDGTALLSATTATFDASNMTFSPELDSSYIVYLDGNTLCVGTPKVAIGSTQYGSLSAALSAAESGDTITALVDGLEVSEDSSIAVTLDLDGHTATISAALTNLSITNAGGITFYESLADDGVISASITWSGSASVTVIGNNGAIISNATVTTSGSTTTVKFAPTVSGTACLYDWTFTNTLASVGTDTTSLNYDTGYSASNAYISSNAFTYGYALNTLATPYTSGGVSYPDSWTCLIAGIVPDLDYSALITFGTQSGGVIGLISTSDTDVLLVRTTGNSAYETLASMTVANARTASHTYAFVKTTSSITVYLDGKLWNVTAVDSPSFGAQLQVGSVHGGVGSTGIKSAKDATAGQSSIQAVRIVSSALGANAIAAFAEEFPYVSPSGNSTRTVTEASETWEQADAWTITTNGVSTTADAPLAGSAITITTTEGVVTTLTCDLEASETYEAITVDGPGSLVFATTDSGAASYTITAAQSAVDEAAVTIKNAVLNLTGGPFTTSNSGSVKFNFDYYSVATATSAASIHLTGVSTSSASVTGEVTGETGDRTLTVSFDSDNSIWIATITCSRSAMNLYISGTSLADGEVCYDSADLTGTAYYPFEGDTLYIDSMTEDSALTISTTYAFPLVFGSSTDKSFTSITAGGAVTLSGAGNLTLTGTDAGTYVIGSTGNLVFAPSDSATYSGSVSLGTDATGVTVISNGTLTISGTIDTDVTVSSGATAKFGVYNAFGGTDEAAGSHTVTVYGTLDINGIAGVNNYTLAEGGVLANTGSHIGTTSRQTTELTLASNATVNAAYNFGLLGSGYGATTITLNGNTLTKTGSAAFWLCNTTTDSSGAIVVSEGTLNVTPGGESHNNGITNYTSTISVPVTVNSGATLSINCNSTFAEIKGAGTVSSDMSATPVVTNLDFSAGLTVSCNMKLADGATVTMPTEGAATFGGTLSSESGAKVTFAYGDRTPAVGDVIIDYTDFTSLYGCSATIEVTGLPSNMATKVTDDGLVVYKRPLMIIIR